MVDKNGQASAEIEVTPEMVEVGVKKLMNYVSDAPGVMTDEEIVYQIFMAMMGAK